MKRKEKVQGKPKNKFSPYITYAFALLIGVPLGLYFALFEDTFSSGLRYYHLVIGLAGLFVGLVLHLVAHEAGHLLFGKLAGYSFVSFRVGSFTVIKEDGKFKRKKLHIPGTGGQCLMEPPAFQKNNGPYILYNLGGSTVNLILSIVALFFFFQLSGSLGAMFFLGAFILVGVFLGLTNAVPLKVGGVANDGYNLKSLLHNEEAKYAFYLQLKINAVLSRGTRLSELPLSDLQMNEAADYSNHLIVSTSLYEYAWYLDHLDMKKAQLALNKASQHQEHFTDPMKKEWICEQLFMELIGECRPEVIEDLYNEEIRSYIELTKEFPSRKRLMMAYAGFHLHNFALVKAYKDELVERTHTYPIKGDAESELAIGEWVIEKINQE